MFRRAPVAFRCTRMSFDFANRVKGPKAPDFAIRDLLLSCVARFVMQPTALHCTSTLLEFICLISGSSPSSWTIETLFSAVGHRQPTIWGTGEIVNLRLTAKFPRAALDALCTSTSGLDNSSRMGSSVSRSTTRTSERKVSAIFPILQAWGYITSFGDLSEGKGGTSLEFDIL